MAAGGDVHNIPPGRVGDVLNVPQVRLLAAQEVRNHPDWVASDFLHGLVLNFEQREGVRLLQGIRGGREGVRPGEDEHAPTRGGPPNQSATLGLVVTYTT